MKIAYVRTGGKGGGGGVQTNAYALRTGGRGGQKLANFCVRTLWMAPKFRWLLSTAKNTLTEMFKFYDFEIQNK